MIYKTAFAVAMIAALSLIAACGSTDPNADRYTGAEFYYSENGRKFSCREPEPYRGGNCRLENTWNDGGVGGW